MISLALCVAYLLAIVVGDTSNQFIFPTDMDPSLSEVQGSFAIGTPINIQWTTIWDTVTLVIWQSGPLTFQYLPNSLGLVNKTSFIWAVDLSGTGGNPQFNLSAGHTFFFGIFHTGTTDVFESQFINITSGAASSPVTSPSATHQPDAPTSIASDTTSTSSTSSSSTSPTSSSSTTPTSPAPTEASDGLSTATKTGIGVGVGIGGFVLIAAAFATGYFFHRRKNASAAHAQVMASEPHSSMTSGNPLSEMEDGRPISQIGTWKPPDRVYEL